MYTQQEREAAIMARIYALPAWAIVALNVLGGVLGIGILGWGVDANLLNYTTNDPRFIIGAVIGAINGGILGVTVANRTQVFSFERIRGVSILWAVTAGAIYQTFAGMCMVPVAIIATLASLRGGRAMLVTFLSWLSIFGMLTLINGTGSFWLVGVLAGLVIGLEFVLLLRPTRHEVTVPEDVTHYTLDLNEHDHAADDYAHGRLTIGADGELVERGVDVGDADDDDTELRGEG